MNEQPNPLALATYDDLDRFSKQVAQSGMFGISNPAQAMCLFAICQSEGLSPASALRRYHLIEGKPSMRADAMLAEFLARGGGVIWHERSDKMVAATFFADKKEIDEAASKRANDRCRSILTGEDAINLSRSGEDTIIRTIKDAQEKKTCMSWDKEKKEWKMKFVWNQNPRQMLTARVISEGVRLIAPGIIAGIYAPEEIEDSREDYTAPAKVNGDRESILAIISDYQRNAMETKDKHEKSRLLGLASDLKLQLDEMESVPAPTNPVAITKQEVKKNAEFTSVTIEAEVLPPEKDEVPMTHATDRPAEPPKVARKKSASTPEPEKKPEAPPAQEQSTQEPQDDEPHPTKWQDYKIRMVKSPSYFGKRLGDLDVPSISVLNQKRGEPNLNHAEEAYRMEAVFIHAAFKEICK